MPDSESAALRLENQEIQPLAEKPDLQLVSAVESGQIHARGGRLPETAEETREEDPFERYREELLAILTEIEKEGEKFTETWSGLTVDEEARLGLHEEDWERFESEYNGLSDELRAILVARGGDDLKGATVMAQQKIEALRAKSAEISEWNQRLEALKKDGSDTENKEVKKDEKEKRSFPQVVKTLQVVDEWTALATLPGWEKDEIKNLLEDKKTARLVAKTAAIKEKLEEFSQKENLGTRDEEWLENTRIGFREALSIVKREKTHKESKKREESEKLELLALLEGEADAEAKIEFVRTRLRMYIREGKENLSKVGVTKSMALGVLLKDLPVFLNDLFIQSTGLSAEQRAMAIEKLVGMTSIKI